VSRKIVRLSVDHLQQLPDEVRQCLFWELAPVSRARVLDADRAAEKEAWLSEVLREWGSCGQVAVVDDRVAGIVCYVPAALAPGAAVLPTAPVSPDAVLMTTMYVAPGRRGGGLGRMLVQGMARDLVKRGGPRAVEAFGVQADGRGQFGCVVPAGFLGAVGFKTQRPHPRVVRMRMDLRATRAWRDEVEHALDRLVGAVRRPAPHVRPGARVSVRAASRR
jgi:GNAT superfamily N-acetyltransferase